MTQHTPGPWRAVRQRGEYAGNYCIRQESATGMLRSFATVYGPNQIAVEREYANAVDANAALIAAAPELLEALKELIEIVAHEHNDFSLGVSGALGARLSDARAAIAKAEVQQ